MHLRAFEQAVAFYRLARKVQLPAFLKLQLQKAASSIALNLSEGSGKVGTADRRHFFVIAMGSIRECQAIAALEPDVFTQDAKRALDQLAASVYRLIERTPNPNGRPFPPSAIRQQREAGGVRRSGLSQQPPAKNGFSG
jgi:four helix bundle protein